MNRIYVLILGMMLVTYLPRLIPLVIMGNKSIPVKVEEFLSYIPYAALGALIVPGFLSAIPEHLMSSLLGILVALILGYYKGGVVFPVVGAVVASMLVINIGL